MLFILFLIVFQNVENFRNKTVVISLWNDLAINVGQELLDIADSSPVVALKSLKVGEFQGNL